MLQVKLWKLKIWNKDARTKEIIVVLNWFIHIKVLRVEVFMKNKCSYLQHFSSCLQKLSNHVTCVIIICVTKFKPEFQKYKAWKCNTFYQCKRVKGQYFWKTSFWLHKLVIQTHFWQNIALFNNINTDETTLFCTFWFYLIPKSVFEVFNADLYVVLHS